jgi:photosystem II stability/assembly factor-like uncharacterized protein
VVALDSRKLRAVVLIVVSITIAGVVGAVYGAPHLHPTAQNAAPPTPTPVETAQGQRATYDFLTPSLGWAVIEAQAANYVWIFRTTDGAKIWRQTAVVRTQTADMVQAFQFFDRTSGYIVVGGFVAVDANTSKPDYRAYLTRDGGAHWTAVASPDPQATYFDFTDAIHGWAISTTAAGSRFYATRDGGQSWSRLPDLPDNRAPLIRTSTEAWMSGDPTGPPQVLTSVDGGVTWVLHSLPQPLSGMSLGPLPRAGAGSSQLSQLVLLPGSGVLAYIEPLCQTKDCFQYGPAAYTSFDGGVTWNRATDPPGGDFASLSYLDGHHWWSIEGNSLWKTADAGQSWSLASDRVIYDHLAPTILDANHAWVQMQVTDDTRQGRTQTAWELDMTTDGGVHWTPVSVPVAG